MNKKQELGQGLQNMLSDVMGIDSGKDVTRLDILKVFPNKSQPRINFSPEEMSKMVESISENGILQPIIVRPVKNGYEIVAGERRWRAAKEVGLKEIPVVIKNIDKEKAIELALIENIQREDLNSIEKAKAYNYLILNYGFKQEDVAKRLSIDRSSVANIVRLLELPEEVQDNVSRGTLSMGHARALLGIKNRKMQNEISSRVEKEGLSVRQVETIVSNLKNHDLESPESKPESKYVKKKSPVILDLEDRLRNSLKTKVSLAETGGRGKIMIEFYDNKQLEHILGLLGVSFEN